MAGGATRAVVGGVATGLAIYADGYATTPVIAQKEAWDAVEDCFEVIAPAETADGAQVWNIGSEYDDEPCQETIERYVVKLLHEGSDGQGPEIIISNVGTLTSDGKLAGGEAPPLNARPVGVRDMHERVQVRLNQERVGITEGLTRALGDMSLGRRVMIVLPVAAGAALGAFLQFRLPKA